jgi:hypothetical protein
MKEQREEKHARRKIVFTLLASIIGHEDIVDDYNFLIPTAIYVFFTFSQYLSWLGFST